MPGGAEQIETLWSVTQMEPNRAVFSQVPQLSWPPHNIWSNRHVSQKSQGTHSNVPAAPGQQALGSRLILLKQLNAGHRDSAFCSGWRHSIRGRSPLILLN
ncbi:hypothetical protein H1C71_000331, partial [Ictidomys tridecemlineatus]